MAKSIQFLNDATFKNYLKEARLDYLRPTASQMLHVGGDAYQ